MPIPLSLAEWNPGICLLRSEGWSIPSPPPQEAIFKRLDIIHEVSPVSSPLESNEARTDGLLNHLMPFVCFINLMTKNPEEMALLSRSTSQWATSEYVPISHYDIMCCTGCHVAIAHPVWNQKRSSPERFHAHAWPDALYNHISSLS